MRAQMRTRRLELRWLQQEDAEAVQTGCNNWNVAKMLARVPHPYPNGLAEDWIAGHAAARAAGNGSPYAIILDGTFIGVIGIERVEDGHEDSGTRSNNTEQPHWELGYWLNEPHWGKGYATEAAQAAVTIGFADLGAARLVAGHYDDNAASGGVLTKCGFEYSGPSTRPCVARGEDMPSQDLVMHRQTWIKQLAAQKDWTAQ